MNFEPTNLDALSTTELRQIRMVFRQLAYYSDVKANAQDARLNGRIAQAKTLEQTCEAIYQQLPKWARW
jgi:hypothetical protein